VLVPRPALRALRFKMQRLQRHRRCQLALKRQNYDRDQAA
jgi:hypothetical protein